MFGFLRGYPGLSLKAMAQNDRFIYNIYYLFISREYQLKLLNQWYQSFFKLIMYCFAIKLAHLISDRNLSYQMQYKVMFKRNSVASLEIRNAVIAQNHNNVDMGGVVKVEI